MITKKGRMSFEEIRNMVQEAIAERTNPPYNKEVEVSTELDQEDREAPLPEGEDLMENKIVDEKTLEYRKGKLESRLDRIRDLIMGREESFLSFVVTEKGRLSEPRIRKFIKELIESHPRAEEFSEAKREFMEHLFYCAIVGPSTSTYVDSRILCPMYSIAEKFEDLVSATCDPIFYEKDRAKVAGAEEEDRLLPENGHGFSFVMNYIYECLSGKSSRNFYLTDEEKRSAVETWIDIAGSGEEDVDELVREWEEDPKDSADAEENSDAGESRESSEDAPRSYITVTLPLPTDEEEEEEYWDNEEDSIAGMEIGEDVIDLDPLPYEDSLDQYLYGESDYTWKEYAGHLPQKHHLVEHYQALREMLNRDGFLEEISDMTQLSEEMVDAIIMKYHLAPICYERGYGLIDAGLSRSVDDIRKSVEKSRKRR